MKKVLIAGPISDFGGREVEANIIAKALKNDFDVTLFSTGYMTHKSAALQGLANVSWGSALKNVVKNNFILNLFSKVSKIKNKGQLNSEAYINNSASKFLFNLDSLIWKQIEKQLKNTDVVILCVQLATKFLPEIVNYCHLNHIKCLIRTTGTISKIEVSEFQFLKKVDLFIHHSEKNANKLNLQIKLPYVIIDQCALNEDKLLELEHEIKGKLRYGYLGRLSAEKGIVEIAHFFANKAYNFIIAGEGLQEDEVKGVIRSSTHCSYIGAIENDKIYDFFNQIDALIIPSHEETGPLVGLEAMAAGKIIISTKVGAMEERLKDTINNFWFQIEDLSTLQQVINQIELLNLEQINKIGSELRCKYIQDYSLHATSTQYIEIVKSLK